MLERPNFEFRRAQAAFDLIWLLKSLDDTRLAHAGSEAFPKVVRHRSCRFESDADAKCFETLVSGALETSDGAEIAVAMIVANDLQRGHWHGDAKEIAEFAVEPVRQAPHKLRAAILRGLDALEDLSYRYGTNEYFLPKESRLTRPINQVLPKLCTIARGMDLPTRKSVAAADHGCDIEKHLEALENVLAAENCTFSNDEYWYPSEVVELASHVRDSPGFVPCTALLLANAVQGKNDLGWFEFRWSNLAADYNALPDSVRAPILAGLRCLYEAGEDFLTYTGHKRCDPVTAPDGMIDFVELADDIT